MLPNSQKRLSLLVVLISCILFYLAGIEVGTPERDTARLLFGTEGISKELLDSIIEAREVVYAGYQQSNEGLNEKVLDESDISYLNFLRGYFLRSSMLDSQKVFGVLYMMKENRLNPTIFYDYGSAYLIPLGGYLYLLDKIGIIHLTSNIRYYINEPFELAKIIVMTRLFIVLTTFLSLLVLYFIARRLVSHYYALLAVILYGLSPLVVVYSHDVKPHLYSNLFFLLSIYFSFNLIDSDNKRNYLLAAFFAGLSFGSTVTSGFSLFFIFIIHGYKNWTINKRLGSVLLSFLDRSIILAVSCFLATFIISNPYFILDNANYINHIKSTNSTFYEFNGILVRILSTYTIVFYLFGVIVFPIMLLVIFFKKTPQLKILLTFFVLYFLLLSYFAIPRFYIQCIPLFALLSAITISNVNETIWFKPWVKKFILGLFAIQILVFVVIDFSIVNFYSNLGIYQKRVGWEIEKASGDPKTVYFIGGLVRERIPIINVNKVNLVKGNISIEKEKPNILISLGEEEKKLIEHMNGYRLQKEIDTTPFMVKRFNFIRRYVEENLDISMLKLSIFERI